jgi:hypothetical protein
MTHITNEKWEYIRVTPNIEDLKGNLVFQGTLKGKSP